jgi:hypothetical protein
MEVDNSEFVSHATVYNNLKCHFSNRFCFLVGGGELEMKNLL